MITVLEYLVIAAVIGLVVFVIAVFVFGRGEQMAALPARTSPSELPDDAIGGDDVRRVRFGLALRGYRMSDVDWTLDRLAEELDRLHRRVGELTGEPLPPGVGAAQPGEDLFEPQSGDEAPRAAPGIGEPSSAPGRAAPDGTGPGGDTRQDDVPHGDTRQDDVPHGDAPQDDAQNGAPSGDVGPGGPAAAWARH